MKMKYLKSGYKKAEINNLRDKNKIIKKEKLTDFFWNYTNFMTINKLIIN